MNLKNKQYNEIPAIGNADVEKLTQIRNSFLHGYNSYTDLCIDSDDLNPVSGTCHNWVGRLNTLIDSLSTMYLMNLTDEFDTATTYIIDNLQMSNQSVSFFETTIRVLGGLLSAHTFTNNQIFIDKAVKLTDRLKLAFDEYGLPLSRINLITGEADFSRWTTGQVVLAEVGTFQLEYYYLSHVTGDIQYQEYADDIYEWFVEQSNSTSILDGLYPLWINLFHGIFPRAEYSVGALGDSFYEYLLKTWLLTGKSNNTLKQLYLDAMNGIMKHMYYDVGDNAWLAQISKQYTNSNTHRRSNRVHNTTVTEAPISEGTPVQQIVAKHQMDHLACFMPGLMYLGVAHGIYGDQPELEQPHKDAALKLTDTCYKFYTIADTGLPPEQAMFSPVTGDISMRLRNYELRPEVLESITIQYHLTGDNKYREMGWNIYQSIEKHAKVKYGFTALSDCANERSYKDSMESYFFGETLKYLYLLFSDRSVLPLTGEPGEYYVLNTEAHPLKSWKS